MADGHVPAFSLTRGGPFYRVLGRVRLLDRRGNIRIGALTLAVWLPLVIAGVAPVVLRYAPHPLLGDPLTHTRLLIMLPLMLVAERVLELRCQQAARVLRQEDVADETAVSAILARAEHLRDSRIVEAVLVVVPLAGGLIALSGFEVIGFVHGAERTSSISVAKVWYLVVALPLVQLVQLRWVWHWLLWTYVLVRLSRLPLATNAIHPDRAAGLSFLAIPLGSFAVFVASIAALASTSWLMLVQAQQRTLESLVPPFAAYVIIAIAVGCGPLLLFCGHLYRARHRDLERYHALARDYACEFRRRWMADQPADSLLGTPDLQSLNDLGGAYETTRATRPVPFPARSVVGIVAGAAIPMLPVVLAVLPFSELVKHLTRMLLGSAR